MQVHSDAASQPGETWDARTFLAHVQHEWIGVSRVWQSRIVPILSKPQCTARWWCGAKPSHGRMKILFVDRPVRMPSNAKQNMEAFCSLPVSPVCAAIWSPCRSRSRIVSILSKSQCTARWWCGAKRSHDHIKMLFVERLVRLLFGALARCPSQRIG